MRSMSNLFQDRHGTWYARVVVPVTLRSVTNKTELRRSLKTKNRPEANRAALPVLDELHLLLEAAKIDLVVQPLDLSNAADRWYNVIIERLDRPDVRDRFMPLQDAGCTIEPADILRTLLADVERRQPGISDKDRAVRLVRFLTWMAPYIDEAIQVSGLRLYVGSANYQAFARRLADKFLQLSAAVLQNTRTNAMQRHIGQPEIPLVPTGATTTPIIGTRGLSLSALFERYKATVRRREPKKAEGRILEYQVAVDRFIELLGDKGIEEITKRDVAEFRNLMEQLPARPKRNVSAMPLRQQIAHAQEHHLPCLSAATVKKLGHALSAVLELAVEDGLLEYNPAHGLNYAETAVNPLAEPERPYTTTELATEPPKAQRESGLLPPSRSSTDYPLTHFRSMCMVALSPTCTFQNVFKGFFAIVCQCVGCVTPFYISV